MRRWAYAGLVIMLGCVLAGCTSFGDQETNDPSGGAGGTPVAADAPTVSDTPSPTPPWAEDEQQAVDVVQEYLEVWARIGQNVTTADWHDIWTVASDDAGDHAIEVWRKWFDNDWHLIGAPVFTPESVTQPMEDERGKRYVVRGCSVIEAAHVVDNTGAYVGEETRVERANVSYTILRTLQDQYLVVDTATEEGTC